jgi:glycerol-3-phosphate acyltransferase PlsY
VTPSQQIVFAVLLPVSYLVGSIPFGLLVGRWHGIDVRSHGSGNIGATNIGRVLGPRAGALVFTLDLLKGFAPALAFAVLAGVLHYDRPWSIHLAHVGVAAAAVLGHVFPVWLGFKGGKGVATGLGALLGTFPVLTFVAVGAAVIWFSAVRVTRMVGISSVVAGLSMPLLVLGAAKMFQLGFLAPVRAHPYAWFIATLWPHLVVTGLLACLVVYTHRSNIARTIAGTEPKIGRPGRRPTPGAAR